MKQIADRIVEFRRVPASSIKPNSLNPRRHPKAQREATEEVLSRIGMADALIVRRCEQEGYLFENLDGHLRAEILGDQLVWVVVVDLDDAEVPLFLATFDPLSALATNDEGALSELLKGMDASSEGLRLLLSRLAAEASLRPRPDADDVASKVPARARPGDVFRTDLHTIGCIDSRDPDSFSRVMDGELARMVLTDPPFGVHLEGRGKRRMTIEGDDEGAADLAADVFRTISAHVAPSSGIYVFHPSGPAQARFLDAITGAGWSIRQLLVWLKDSMVLSHSDYHHRAEVITYACSPGPARFGRGGVGWYGSHSEQSVLEFARPKASALHPSMKPVALLQRLICNSSAPGDVVIDPFLGSGSSLIAAEVTGRRLIGADVDPAYVDAALARYESFTGTRAKKVSS